MSTTPITFDMSTAQPLAAPTTPAPDAQAAALQSAVSFAAQQKPDHYVKLLQFQKLTGVPPVVSQGNEEQVQQAADANRLDPRLLTTMAPITSAWASNPDNAAVSGVDEIHRQAGIERNAAGMRASYTMPTASAYTPTLWQRAQESVANAVHAATGRTTDQLKQGLYEDPLTRFGMDTIAGASGLVGNIGALFGIQGSGPTKQNLLQRVETSLSPEANTDPAAVFHQSTPMDWVAKNIGPMIPAVLASGGTSLLARALGWSPTAAKVASGLTVGGMFTADQAGRTYTDQLAGGASDYDARLASNRVALINALPNSLFGATDVVPWLRDNPLLTSLGLGGATGATGQIGQNVVTGQPWSAGVPSAMLQGAAMQGGMHLGADGFAGNLAQAVDAAEQSQLRERAPDKFYEANQAVFAGDASLRIPADQFSAYFNSKGMDPAQMARTMGSSNYAEAVLSGGDVEVPPADFLSKINPEHQRALLPDVVDPSTGLTPRQHQEGRDELEQWATGGGADKLVAETAAADAETAATPEFQQVKEQLRQKYADAGETPEVAETLATKDANVYNNLARNAGMKPSELLALYNPKVVTGEAPEGVGTGTDEQTAGAPSAALHQSSQDESQPRGWFRTLPDGSYEIGKTKIGDLSTFVHEPAHAYLRILGDLAKRDGASDVMKADHAKVLDFLGAKDGEALTREQQETWARANEQYLREGKAPSPGLKGTFQRFAIWLGSVYRKASDLGVHLSDDIRGVFDRLYAAEDGVNRAETEAGPKLFHSAEEAGWTDEQFKNYAEVKGVGVEQAKAEILAKLNEAAVREKSETWRDEERNVRAAVTAEVDQSPEYTAIRTLRKGQMADGTELTLNRQALVDQFGEDRVKELQKLHPGLYRTEGGIDPESAAEMLGFRSAEEMVTSLQDVPRRSEVIEKGTRYYMTQKHGDIRFDGTLDDQARIALENDKRAGSLYSELKALRKKLADAKEQASGQKQAMREISVAPIDAYREAAHQMVEAKAVADLQPTRYLDASRKYSREAFDALRSGDAQAAANAKHKELMNHFLFREATKAKEYVGKFESYAKRMQSKGVQSSLGKAGDDYRDQFNRVLARYGLGPATGAPDRTLAEWATEQYGEGKEPAIDPQILNEARTINYRNAPVSEVRLVHDALVNIRKLASLELGMVVNGRKVEFSSAVAAMSSRARESIKENPTPVFDEDRTIGQTGRDLVQRGMAPLIRTEFLMKRLDGGVEGPWHDNLWHLAADAQGVEMKLQEEVTGAVGDALANMPKEQRMKMRDKVAVPGIDLPITRKRMLSMAFNMGNEGNMDRLEKTFIANGWDPRAAEHIKGLLTREEWQFVQGAWDSLKPLGQAQSELEQRLTGLPPVMVTPTPLHLKLADGTEMDLAGGYYPIVMDPKYSARGAQQDASSTAQNLMESGYGRAVTSRGNMQARTGFGGPLLLDYEQVLTQHLSKVTKDISHREFILTANKLMMDQQLRQTLQDTVGQGYEKQMMPWLRTLVNDRNGSAVQGLGDLSDWMGKLRTNLVEASLGFKASTILLQLTHASSIFLHTSAKSYAQAMIDFLAHPSEMTEQIQNLSPNEMNNRGENIDRDMRAVLQDGVGRPGIGKIVAKAGMFPVRMMDHVLSFPLWLSVYRDTLAEKAEMPEDEAKYQAMQKADGAVRMGLGSNAPKDLPAVMRKNDFWKLVTTLGGFHNLKLNQIADVSQTFARDRDFGRFAYGAMMAAIIPAVIGAYVSGNRPKDGENPGEWAAKRALLFAPETVPLAGDIVQAWESGRDAKFTPLANMAEKAVTAGTKATSDKPEKDWTGIGMDASEAAGDAFGVPGTAQAVKTLRYANRAAQGKIANPNLWDAVVGAPAHK